MKLLEVKDMSMLFGGLTAVDCLDLQVDEKEVVGLIGPNGSGKTTVINCIAGFYHPAKGQVIFRGKDITGLRPHEIASIGIGRTFQITGLLTNSTVLDNVMTGLHLRMGSSIWHAAVPTKHGSKRENMARDLALEILNFTGLISEKDTVCAKLPHYSRKCLALAIALATEPSLLLLDEVVSGLSGAEAARMIDLLTKVHESGIAIMLVEHNMRVITSVSHRIVVLNFGAKIAEGTPPEIMANKEVQRAYLGGY